MMTEIYYNGISISSGIGPVPFISRNEEMINYGGLRWGQASVLTLDGQITGILDNYTNLISRQNELLSRLNQNYQTLELYEGGIVIYSHPLATIRNITFPESTYVGVVPYKIEFLCYPNDYFSGYFGVLEPVDSFEFKENTNGTINLVHKCSAKGFTTSNSTSNALANAIAYVQSKSGWNNQVLPNFINVCTGLCPNLITLEEVIDRLNGNYSITEIWLADPKTCEEGVFSYKVDISETPQDGLTQVRVNGNLQGGKNQSITGLRARYNAFDVFSTANHYYYLVQSGIDLNPYFLSSGITENLKSKKVTFDILFDNSPEANVNFNYKITVDTDKITDISNVMFEGLIHGRGDILNRYNRVYEYYQNLDILYYANLAYMEYGLSYPLNPNPTSKSVTINEFAGEINIGVNYNNNSTPPSGLKKIDYSINWNPSIEKYSSIPLITNTTGNHGYYIVDLGFANRAECTINGTALIDESGSLDTGLTNLKNYINYLSSIHASGNRKVLANYSFTKEILSKSKQINFSASWSYEDSKLTI